MPKLKYSTKYFQYNNIILFTTAKGKATTNKIKMTGGDGPPNIDAINERVIRAYNGTVTVTVIHGID